MKTIMRPLFLAASLIVAIPSSANDSSAAVGLGGLVLTQSDAISMDSEELFISREKVTVKYRFTNTSTQDVETLVSFPLPPIPGDGDTVGETSYPLWSELGFITLVDGKPVELAMRDEVELIGRPGGKNVAARLAKLAWPVRYWEDQSIYTKIDALTQAEKKQLVAEGLLFVPEYDGEALEPNWRVTTHVTRKQTFPAGKTITVEHSYKPVAGGSVGGALIPEYRKDGGEYIQSYMQQYCMDKAFLAGFDKQYGARLKAAKAKGDDYGSVPYTEHWVSYVLKSGANWKGPIKDFRLVIDKGKSENLVSFCMDGVKKIAPTQFEVRKKNFEPAKDLDILIVEFYDFDGN